jgi:hypothetical protein
MTFIKNLESFLKKAQPHVDPPSTTPPASEPVTPVPSVPNTMANKMLHEYSIPTVANVPVGPAINTSDANFVENWPNHDGACKSILWIAQRECQRTSPTLPGVCNTIVMEGVAPEIIRLHLFSFSLLGRAKQWFYKDWEVVNTWNKCSTPFLTKFFPMGKTNAFHGRISNFQ